jgi:arabinogalactan endo-1,4-beta-galactosidase
MVDTQIILHVADPKNVTWWFDKAMENSQISDFDIIGFSYYPVWHTEIRISQLDEAIAGFKDRYKKDIMILEVAYLWTSEGNDNYHNLFGATDEISGYPISLNGHNSIMKDITQAVIDGGGIGIIYWEPAWITSNLKDKWGAGSSWENNAFFDYDGEANAAFDYMTFEYSESN